MNTVIRRRASPRLGVVLELSGRLEAAFQRPGFLIMRELKFGVVNRCNKSGIFTS